MDVKKKTFDKRTDKTRSPRREGRRDDRADRRFDSRDDRGGRRTPSRPAREESPGFLDRRDSFGDKAPDDDGELGSTMILGRNPVIEALKSEDVLDRIYVDAEATGSVTVIIRLAGEQGVPVKRVKGNKLDLMSGGAAHQGVIAYGACGHYVAPEDILDIAAERGEDPFIIICDEIEDPHNLGAIIRTAETVGAHGVIIPKRRSASLSPTVFKTSAGAASYMPVARVANLPAAVDMLKKRGVWIYGTDGAGQSYTDTDLTGPIGLVIGSEGFGMGKLMKEKCDFLVSLPMRGRITSLNASVAAGIFMYEILRQRGLGGR